MLSCYMSEISSVKILGEDSYAVLLRPSKHPDFFLNLEPVSLWTSMCLAPQLAFGPVAIEFFY